MTTSKILDISSSANGSFKRWQGLLESRGIKKERACILSGEKLVREFMAAKPEAIEEILLPPKSTFDPGPFRAARLSSPLFQELDVINTRSAMAVVKIAPLPEWEPAPPQGLELIVSLSDPANLGALIRSAEAFGVSRVILTRECASPYLPKALKAASLSTFRVKLCSTGSIQELNLSEALGLDLDGEEVSCFAWPKDAHLILGEEGQGLPSTLAVKRLKISMSGQVESLNATVAAALAMYSYRQQSF